MAKVNLRDLTILAGQDGTAVVLSADLRCGPGDFAFDALKEAFSAVNAIYCNGVFEEMTYGSQEPVTGSVTIYHDGSLTDTITGKPLDFVLKTGLFASGTTVNPGGQGPWACDLVWGVSKGGVVSQVKFHTCRLTASYATNAEANTISLSWEAHGRPGFAPVVIS